MEYSSFSTYHHSVQLQLIFFSEKLHLFAAVAGAEFRISWLGVCLPKNKLVNMNEFSSLHMPVKFMYLFASCAVSNSFAKFVSSSSRYHIFFSNIQNSYHLAALKMVTLRFLTPRRIVDYCRRLLSTDLVTALRPFYQAIRTDGLAHNPAEKRVNEESLRLLCSHLESLTGPSASCLPPDGHLEFYIPSGSDESGSRVVSRLVRVQVDRSLLDPRAVISQILRSCKLLPKEKEQEQMKRVNQMINS